jgi:HEAT repeat protein
MFAAQVIQEKSQKISAYTPLVSDVQTDAQLLPDLQLAASWGERQAAVREIGYLRSPNALPALLAVVQEDAFWMVRFAAVQALEIIGDLRAVPVLMKVAEQDQFQVVRSYAGKALRRLLAEASGF